MSRRAIWTVQATETSEKPSPQGSSEAERGMWDVEYVSGGKSVARERSKFPRYAKPPLILGLTIA